MTSGIESCLPGEWLTDEPIDFFINALRRRLQEKEDNCFTLFNCCFWSLLLAHGPEKAEHLASWKSCRSLWKSRYWLIPVHDTDHWCLLIVRLPENELQHGSRIYVYILDSLRKQNGVLLCTRLKTFIAASWKKYCRVESDKTLKQVRIIPRQLRVPLQTNGSDCGAYLLLYMHKFVEQPIHEDRPDWFPPQSVSHLRDTLYIAMKQQTQ